MSSGLYSGVSGLALGTGLYRNVSGLWGGSSGLIDAFGGGGGPFPGASLYLDFLTPPLDSRITFSRGTNATLVDSTGKITYAPANFLLRSEEFDNIVWTKTSGGLGVVPVVTANADVAPDGTTTADRIQFSVPGNTNGSGDFSVAVQIPAGSGPALCSSVWMRSNTGTNQTVFIRAGDTFLSLTVTPTWQRYSVTQSTASTAFTFNIGIRGSVTPNVTSADVLVWGAQLEPVTYQTTPGTYNATTASAYYGPRFDYDPVTLAPRGLLIEEARTNLLLQSETFDNASWPKTDATVTANVTNAPSGTAVADKLAETATTAAHSVSQIVTIAIGTSYTYTVYAKAAERNWIALQFTGGMTANHGAYFDLANGVVGSLINSPASASITKLADGWYRCSITSAPATGTSTTAWVYTASGNNVVSYLGTAGSGVYLWGAQFEAGAFATSYIPTVASTVSRSADNASMTGTNFSSWYNQPQGTFVVDADTVATGNRIIEASAGSLSRVVDIYTVSGPAVQMWNGTAAYSPFNNFTLGLPFKVAGAYQTANYAVVLNGGAVRTDAAVLVNTADSLQIGRFSSGTNYLNGHIRAIAYYNTRLPNTQLQTLTAPSLASPLALDFLSTSYTVGY